MLNTYCAPKRAGDFCTIFLNGQNLLTPVKTNHRLKKLLIYSLLLAQFARSQSAHHFSHSGYIGSGAYSKKFIDGFSFISNPAALSQTTLLSAGLFTEKKFLLKELNVYTIAIAIPTSVGGFGILTRYNGFNDYNETQLGLGYAKNLGHVDLGIQFNYTAIRIAGYGTNSVVQADAGMVWHVMEKLHTGVHLMNVVAGKLSGNANEKPALIFKMGLGYEVSDAVFISSEICKEEDKIVTVIALLQYTLAGKFYLKGGISTATSSPWLGAGLRWKMIRIDITSGYHPQLGITPGLLLIFSSEQKGT